jgi:hypothetical protein
VKQDDIMVPFRRLFAAEPALAVCLSSLRDLDAAAEFLDRIGACHGIASSAAGIRGYVRQPREESRPDAELPPNGLTASAPEVQPTNPGGDFMLMLACPGQAPPERR